MLSRNNNDFSLTSAALGTPLFSTFRRGLVCAVSLIAASSMFAASADLMLTLNAVPSPAVAGDNLTLTYAITNKGPDAATSILLTNLIPGSVILNNTAITNGTWSVTNGLFYWSLDNLGPNTEAMAELVVTPVNSETLTNIAGVVAVTPDPATYNNLEDILVPVMPFAAGADLVLKLNAIPNPVVVGGNLRLTYAITNEGPEAATGILLTNLIPGSVIVKNTLITNGTWSVTNGLFSWSLDNLGPNTEAMAELVVTPVNTETLTNRAGVVAVTPDPATDNNLSASIDVTVNPLTTADLGLTLKAIPSPAVLGGNLRLTYAITNNGPDAATGILLTNLIPRSVIVKNPVITNGTCSVTNGIFSWFLANLEPHTAVMAELVVAPVNTETLTNKAGLVTSSLDPTTFNSLNRSLMVTVKPLAAGAILQLRRSLHTATLLADGRVLLAGGWTNGIYSTRTAEVYSPELETFALTGDMSLPRVKHTATLLPDGFVLVAGGETGSGPTTAVDLYNPAGGVFSAASPMGRARSGHTATLLPDGRVLIAGGAVGTNALELYDGARGTFSNAGNSVVERSGHSAALLPNGKVLLVGGAGPAMLTAEVYDPQVMASHAVPNLPTNFSSVVATSMSDGRVLVYGRKGAACFNPDTEQFVITVPPVAGRGEGRLTLLRDGRLLVSGGVDGFGYVATTEIYDPASNSFTAGSPMTTERYRHSATALRDGRVLLAGGYNGRELATSEFYALTVDMDLDGMEDQWELKHGFDPADRNDAALDADLDGLNNLQEYLAGTDPRDPNSVMRIDTCQINSATFRIRFNTVQGKTYCVERTSDSEEGSWSIVSNYILGTGAFVEVSDALVAGASPRLYRVRLLQ